MGPSLTKEGAEKLWSWGRCGGELQKLETAVEGAPGNQEEAREDAASPFPRIPRLKGSQPLALRSGVRGMQ